MKGLMVDESMTSNFTSTSGEASDSSATRFETATATQHCFASTNQPKKKRSLPGNPDPDAEVIALSPKTLLATNRFTCEICNKGFKRDQNLQLHRRGHNLPWKLKQRINKEEVIRKKVYVCPETTCVHHDPSRALGDLTGIKKHFCRKHGEKKWKCEKCSKRYAVQSDWKAHSKICGTREYRCDCGTLFSRRDSFITHRAFCDALAEESARAIAAHPNPLLISSTQQMGASSSVSLSHMQSQLHSHYNDLFINAAADHRIPPWLARPSSSSPLLLHHDQLGVEDDQNPSQNPIFINPQIPKGLSSTGSASLSATALLQKAAQMGVTISYDTKPLQSPVAAPMQLQIPHQTHMSAGTVTSTTTVLIGSASSAGGSSLGLSAREQVQEVGVGSGFPFPHGYGSASFGNYKAAITSASSDLLHHDMMNTSPCTTGFDGSNSSFQHYYSSNGIWNNTKGSYSNINFQETLTDQSQSSRSSNVDHQGRGNDGLTRDFLGLKAFPPTHHNFPNLAARLNHINQQHQKP